MTPPPRTAREEERSLNLRTLVIASAASATAALVTSRLWIAGTWLAAAMTPVIVALVSELLHRPTQRIARGVTSERAALPDPEAPARRVAERLREEFPRAGEAPLPDPDAPADPLRGRPSAPSPDPLRGEPPVRIYRAGSTGDGPRGARSGGGPAAGPVAARRRRIAYRLVLVTAALAFLIGAVALTATELIAGSSLGKSDRRTTLIPTTRHKSSTQNDETQTNTTPDRTNTTQQPTDTEQTTPQTDTTTTPVPATPQGEPAPTDTTGTTSTTPSQP